MQESEECGESGALVRNRQLCDIAVLPPQLQDCGTGIVRSAAVGLLLAVGAHFPERVPGSADQSEDDERTECGHRTRIWGGAIFVQEYGSGRQLHQQLQHHAVRLARIGGCGWHCLHRRQAGALAESAVLQPVLPQTGHNHPHPVQLLQHLVLGRSALEVRATHRRALPAEQCVVGSLAGRDGGRTFAMELTEKSAYGEFKNKFKGSWVCSIFIPLTVMYRICLGFYCAVKSDDTYSTLMTIGISMAFVLYAIVNLPFTEASQNYRSCICHVTMLMILFNANYYRTMKDNTPMQVKAVIYAPAIIELALMGGCITVSIGILIYEIFKMVKDYRSRKISPIESEKVLKNITPTQQSQINVNNVNNQ